MHFYLLLKHHYNPRKLSAHREAIPGITLIKLTSGTHQACRLQQLAIRALSL